MGRAAVVSDAPGCREVVVDGVNGRVVPVRDPLALEKAMEHFVLHPQDIVRMGIAGRKMAEDDFDARKVAAGILRLMRLDNFNSGNTLADGGTSGVRTGGEQA